MKHKLTTRFLIAAILPVLIITIVYSAALSWVLTQHKQKIDTYAATMVDSISQNIELKLQNMMNAGRTYSFSDTVQAMAEQRETVSLVPLSSMTAMARSYNSDLVDVLLTDIDGVTYSLVGYLNGEVEQRVMQLASRYYEGESENQFLMFNNQQASEQYMLYFMPVFSTGNSPHYGQKVGTITILCRASSVIDAVDTAEDMLIEIADAETQASLVRNTALRHSDVTTLATLQSGNLQKKVLEGTNLVILGMALDTGYDSETNVMLGVMVAGIVAVVLLVAYLIIVTNRLFIHRIQTMNNDIVALGKEEPGQRLRDIPDDEIGSIAMQINTLLDTIHSLNADVIEHQEQLFQMEIMKRKSQIYAYESQINPHFLYNMLQCMRGIALNSDMREIADICTNMADVFRYSIKGESLVSLERELEIIEKYLYMLRIRFRDRITYRIDVPQRFNACRIPKLILQPLVENAVFHGLAPVGYSGNVHLYARQKGDTLLLYLYNNGVGIAPETLDRLCRELKSPIEEEFKGEDTHIGLLNVHNKIRLYFGEEYGITLESDEEATVIILHLPLGDAPLEA